MNCAMPLLTPQTLLTAYAQGVFPMTDPDGKTRWYTADPRGILPLDSFHISHTLAQFLRRDPPVFDIRINCDFQATIQACRELRIDHTWISPQIVDAYLQLHSLGFAHSVEAWRDEKLVGGLYGVSLGAAFFGESMFHRVANASKAALVALVQRLRKRRFELLDTQATTRHLRQFGCVDIPAEQYLERLRAALDKQRRFD